MDTLSEYPFTAAQFHELGQDERQAILAVGDYLNGHPLTISDEDLSEALNLMRPTQGCVPQEEIDEDPSAGAGSLLCRSSSGVKEATFQTCLPPVSKRMLEAANESDKPDGHTTQENCH